MRRRAVLLLGLLAAAEASAAPSAAEQARIERLIGYVETQTNVRFVRNGSSYSSADAAKFLRRKFEKMGEHVTNARHFIEQIASKSSTSGEPYFIRFPDGRQMPAARFLEDELVRMDRGA